MFKKNNKKIHTLIILIEGLIQSSRRNVFFGIFTDPVTQKAAILIAQSILPHAGIKGNLDVGGENRGK